MKPFLLTLFLFSLKAVGQMPQGYSVSDLKNGKYKQDTSFIYSLPYKKGTSCLLAQAYQSNLSHKGEYALDFKMKPGTKIFAARGGVVLSCRKDSDKGGLKPDFLSEGNYIIIQHEDGSYGHYWHLQYNGVLVKEGDIIEQGQLIGLSGNTGYSAFPHLHFEVTTNGATGSGQLPTRFYTKKGARYLRPGRWHKAV